MAKLSLQMADFFLLHSLFSDVTALASSIGELTLLCRRARTANWSALQMTGLILFHSLFSDVTALASSIGELTLLCRRARTANWSALQMADKDSKPIASLGIDIKTGLTDKGFVLYDLQTSELLTRGEVSAEESSPKKEDEDKDTE